MGIEYLATDHRFLCDSCGSTFTLNIGDIYNKTVRSDYQPHFFVIHCPNCKRKARVEATSARRLGLYREKTKNLIRDDGNVERLITVQGVVQGMDSVNELLGEIRTLSCHLLCLKHACRHAVRQWRENYQRAVLTQEIAEIERTLKEINVPDPNP